MFSEQKQTHEGLETSKHEPHEMGMTPQYFHTIPTSCAILQLELTFFCVYRRVVEGSGVRSAVCVVHNIDMHRE